MGGKKLIIVKGRRQGKHTGHEEAKQRRTVGRQDGTSRSERNEKEKNMAKKWEGEREMHKMLVSLEEKMQMQRTVFMYHHGVFKLLINIYIQTVHESRWSRVMSSKEI